MRSAALTWTIGVCGFFCIDGVATGIDQLQMGAEGRMIRREQLQPGVSDASLMQAKQKKSGGDSVTPNFDNGSFETCTLTTDHLGVQFYTHALAATRTETPEHWKGSGTVKMVPSGSADFGELSAPHGGVFVALQTASAEVSQLIHNHVAGKKYMLSFNAATAPNQPEGTLEIHMNGASSADALSREGGATDGEPDWKEALVKWFVTYDFVYTATKSDVTFIIKNASPADAGSAAVLVDGFDISECSKDGECD